MDKHSKYIIYLLKCVIKNELPETVPDDINWELLFNLAQYHNVSNLVYYALQNCLGMIDPQTVEKLTMMYDQYIVVEVQQQYYLDLICDSFEDAGILYVPMKGSVIKHLYPEPNLRSSTDIDVYIGKGNAAKAKAVMDKLDFETIEYDAEVLIHDTYRIGDFVMVELHHELLPKVPYFKGIEICPELQSSIIPMEGKKYGYEFTKESFYIFMILHIAKHVKHNGMGIRGYLDVWIYLREYKDILDWDLINELFEKADLTTFHNKVLGLVDYWFNEKKTDDADVLAFSAHTIGSGLMGTQQMVVSEEPYKNKEEKKKHKYYIDTIFLPMEFMRDKYKILRKAPALLPLCWIHRILNVVLFKRSRLTTMKEHFNDADMARGERIVKLKERLGL